ncbi:MAG: 50S ribosomal protein L17 [Candidatus Vogelbacteria bacterium RIFOXYD1_FULL_51_18]|uniref:Large ribosomal subunit protein bL17 n=1 Tax=Candidatus Vogelbacteria bacterium RIFOXYD1_FULL_51_18 TaxID=1802440 RepID=A0A1G2QJL6_9BACT|nr:MAG: 50S ribosomal protein L17 [Candidatus Vogelbacteria bacterium RIFOXYD1_FULL_51_18]
MRHHDTKRKFGRERNVRTAFLRSLMRNLINEGRITTTLARAKEVRPLVEKLVTRGKNSSLASRRLLVTRLGGVREAKKLAEEISPKYASRPGGYTRIIKLPAREGDASLMALIEFV